MPKGSNHRVPPVVLVIFMTFDSFLDIKHSEYSRRGGGWDRKKDIKRKSIVSKNVSIILVRANVRR